MAIRQVGKKYTLTREEQTPSEQLRRHHLLYIHQTPLSMGPNKIAPSHLTLRHHGLAVSGLPTGRVKGQITMEPMSRYVCISAYVVGKSIVY